MTGSVLFITGRRFDVDAFIKVSKWHDTATVFHKGDKTGNKLRPVELTSGLRIDVTSADVDNFKLQIRSAIKFLSKFESEFRRLKRFKGVENIELSMGSFWYQDTVHSSIALPSNLLALAGKNSVEISINLYATEEKRKNQEGRNKLKSRLK